MLFESQLFSHSLQDSSCPKVKKQEMLPSNFSQFISRNIQMIGPKWPDEVLLARHPDKKNKILDIPFLKHFW